MFKMMMVCLLQFLSGSIMYSYLLGRLGGVDLSLVGDGNPGLSNLWKAKGRKLGLLGLILDYFKGIFPLALLVENNIIKNEYLISLAALCGILGHAFSPLLKFKGGKAVTTTFGAWTVLTRWEAPTILGSTFALYTFLKPRDTGVEEDALVVLLGFAILLPYVLYKLYTGKIHLFLFYLGNLGILSYKYWPNWSRFFKNRIR